MQPLSTSNKPSSDHSQLTGSPSPQIYTDSSQYKDLSLLQIFIAISCILSSLSLVIPNVIEFSNAALSGADPYDFPNYYFSGLRLFEGRPVYELLNLELFNKFGWVYDAYMADPPFTVVLLSPLSLMTYTTAWWTFLTISIAAIFVGSVILLKDLGLKTVKSYSLASLILASQSSLYLLKRNHLEALLFIGLIIFISLLRRHRYLGAAIVLGIVAAIKLFPAFIFLTGARKLGAKNSLIGVAVMIALSTAGIVICDWGDPSLTNTTQYISEVLGRSENWLGTIGNFSVRSFLVAFGVDSQVGSLPYIILSSLIALSAIVTGLSKSNSTSTWVLASTAAALLLSPLAWLNYLILLVPPAAYYYNQHHSLRATAALRVVILIGLVIYWPTYIETGYLILTKVLSLFPTLILSYLVIKELPYPLLAASSDLLKFLKKRCSNCPK